MLTVTNLRAGYGAIEVLHGIDLAVPAGSVVAVLGANGAGKTTLLATISGLLRARRGQITFAGGDITTAPLSSRARAGLCLILQGRGIFRQLTVADNVAMFAGGRGVADAFDAVAEAFPPLAQRRHQLAGTLSGGQQQMLAVARAFVTRPRLVMADELSLGLAPIVVDEIFTAMATLRQQGVALLLVEQYAERALDAADYVYYLRKGSIAHVGRPEDYRGDLLSRLHLGTPVGSGTVR